MALVAAAVLMVVATLLHPSRETATTIVASEPRLAAALVMCTVAWLLVLLGLPGLYAAQRGGRGRLGLVGFLTAITPGLGVVSAALLHCWPASVSAWPPGRL